MIPERFLQASINEEIKGKGSPAAFARRLERNFEKLDTELTDLAARINGDFGTTWATPTLTTQAATAATANRMYYGAVQVGTTTTLTGIQWFNVTTAGNVAVALYDSTGARVADVATPVAVGGALAIQQLAFDTAYAASPGLYFLGIVFDNTPQQYHAIWALPCDYTAGPGAGDTATSITPPTAPTNLIPTMSTY